MPFLQELYASLRCHNKGENCFEDLDRRKLTGKVGRLVLAELVSLQAKKEYEILDLEFSVLKDKRTRLVIRFPKNDERLQKIREKLIAENISEQYYQYGRGKDYEGRDRDYLVITED